MKSDRQLNQPLHVKAETLPRGPVARQSPPHVLQHFVSLEKMAAIEEVEAQRKTLVAGRLSRRWFVSADPVTPPTGFVVSSRDCVSLSRFLHIPIYQSVSSLQKNV